MSRAAFATPTAACASAKSPMIRSYSSRPMAARLNRLFARRWSASSRFWCASAWMHVGLGPVELGLVGPRVDLEEQIPLVDLGPVLEVHLVEIAGDPGADLDREDRVEPAGEVLEIAHRVASPAG